MASLAIRVKMSGRADRYQQRKDADPQFEGQTKIGSQQQRQGIAIPWVFNQASIRENPKVLAAIVEKANGRGPGT